VSLEQTAEEVAERINRWLNQHEQRPGVVHDVLDPAHRAECRDCRREWLRIP
jgi:hypothetical protein